MSSKFSMLEVPEGFRSSWKDVYRDPVSPLSFWIAVTGARAHCASVKDYTGKLVKHWIEPKHSLPPAEKRRTVEQ